MVLRTKLLVAAFLSLLIARTVGQPSKILFDHHTTAEGLSNNQVWSICTDKTGFVWLGTQDGLNRFDGKDFKIFRNSPKDSNSLSHNTVYEVYTDEENTVWIGTFDGLNKYDTRSGLLKRISFNLQQLRNNVDKLIGAIAENKTDHTIWVGGNGLYKVNKKDNTLEPALGILNEKYFTAKGSNIRSMLIESADRIWLGSNRGLFLYNPINGALEQFNTPVRNHLPGVADYFITKIVKDRKGKLWLSTYGAGLLEFDPDKKQFGGIYLPQAENDGFKGGKNIVFDMAQTNLESEQHLLWLATNTPALTAFDIETHQFKHYTTDNPVDKHGIYGSAYSLHFDSQNGLWIGALKGFYRYDKRMQLFTKHTIGRPAINGCLDNIFSICGNRSDPTNNTVWIGTYTCGLYKYNTYTGAYEELPNSIKKILPSGYSCLYQDKEGVLWLGSANNGLYAYDEKTGVVKRLAFTLLGKDSLRYSPKVIFEDAKSQLWIGTNEGIWHLNPSTKQIQKIKWILPGPLVSKTPSNVVGICEDTYGNIWFSASYAYDMYYPIIGKINAGTYTANMHYFHNNPSQEIKNIKVITNIACTKDNQLFCASWHGLINWTSNAQPPNFKLITEEDGLLNNFINSIEKDANDNIWSGTLSGLCKYNPKNNTFRTFANAGLEKDNIEDFAIHAKSGLVIIGDKQGQLYTTNSLDTGHRNSNTSITITDIRVIDKRYPHFGENGFDNAIITLPYKEHVITIQYAAPYFINTAMMRYAYKMEGVDKDWVITSNKSITYNLKDGNYQFMVKALDPDGNWTPKNTGLRITIKAPFWKTTWFFALLLLSMAAIIYWLFKMRLHRLKQVFLLRNKIAKDLHDEIGSTLTSIKILSEVSHHNVTINPAKASLLLDKISEQSAQMQQGMSDIVWAISPENDKLQNLAARMREYIAYTVEPKGIHTHFDIRENVLSRNLTMQQRKDLFLIFKEAVNNAVKHACCNNLYITIEKINDVIRLLIKDDGVGFVNTKSTTSNGMNNMKTRAAALGGNLTVESSTESGTMVQLYFGAT